MRERRKFTRLERDIPVRHKVSGDEKLEHTAAKNISTGGVQLVSKTGLEVGSKLSIELVLPGFDEPFYAQGEVIWARQDESAGEKHTYALGVRFLRVVSRGAMKGF